MLKQDKRAINIISSKLSNKNHMVFGRVLDPWTVYNTIFFDKKGNRRSQEEASKIANKIVDGKIL